MSESQWSRPSYTRDEVIAGRKSGLKYFDKAVAKVGRAKVIADAIALHNDPEHIGTWGPKDCWSHFQWSLGNVWREIIEAGDVQCSFNIDEALTPAEVQFVRQQTGIAEPIDFGSPRKGGIRYNHCPRHDDPEKYAYR